MATARSITEIEDDLAEVRARIRELALGRVPLSGTVGRTSINLVGNLRELREFRRELLDELRLARRRAGQIGPARRGLF